MKQHFKKIRKSKGFTLIELIVVVSILGILMAIAAQKLNSNSTAEENQLLSDMQEILGAAKDYGAGRTLTGVSMATLCDDGYIQTDSICGDSANGTSANPFGGNYTVAVNSSNVNRFDLTATAVPSKIGNSVARKYENSARAVTYTSGSETLTLVYGSN